MSEYKEKIVNVETGQETWRDLTQKEIQEIEKAQAEIAERSKGENEMQIQRKAALNKLNSLGLTTDDLKALGLG